MRARNRFVLVAMLGFGVLAARSALSKDEASSGAAPEVAEMMKKCIEAGSANEMHKNLEPFVGSWKTTSKAWMPGAGTEPSVSTGTAEVQWMLGGRFINEVAKGSFQMPGPDGKMTDVDFEGHGVTGYDNMKKQYTFGWIDSMSTALLTGLGNYDAKTKTFTCYGDWDDAMTGAHGRTMKYVHRVVDANKNVFEMHDMSQGVDGQKMLEVTYERKK